MKTVLSCCALLLLGVPNVRAEEPVVITLATMAPDGSPWAVSFQEFKAAVEKEVPGKVVVRLKLGGSLGDENDTVLQCKRGQIQAVSASIGAVASQVPEVSVLELPYLYANEAEAHASLDRVVAPRLEKAFADRGLVLAFWSENGFRSFGGKFPVTSVADLRGRKMRSQENPIHLAFYRALGASPVPIPATEAVTSLQSGLVEGYDQAPLYAFAASWTKASTHMSITRHIYQPAVILMNKAQFDAWPADVRAAVKRAGQASTGALRARLLAMNPVLMKNLEVAGLKVNVLTDAQKAGFKDVAARVREEYVKKATPGEQDLYRAVVDGLAQQRHQ